jgi:hypothetical protein
LPADTVTVTVTNTNTDADTDTNADTNADTTPEHMQRARIGERVCRAWHPGICNQSQQRSVANQR